VFMQNIERDGYTREQILEVLHGVHNSRNVRFKYNLLDRNEYFIKELETVVSGEVSMSAFSTIKRTAKFKIKETYVEEHTERVNAERQSTTWNTGTHWNSGTHTNTVVNGTNLAISTPAVTAIPYADFEGAPTSWTGGLHPSWRIWGTNITPLKSSADTFAGSSASQKLTRTGTGSIGMRPIDQLVTVATGDKLYLSFLFKPVSDPNGNFAIPNYCYAFGTPSQTPEQPNQVYSTSTAVITDIGDGWFRYDNEVTMAQAGVYSPLIGWGTSAGVDGSVAIENIYFQKNAQPIWNGEWVSAVKDISGNSAVYQNSLITMSGSEQNNAVVDVYSRYSLDDGVTWSSWSLEGNTSINGLESNVTQLDYGKLQFKVTLSRNSIEIDDAQLLSLNFWLDKEIEVVVPKKTEIDYLQNRIQPFMEVQMRDGGWISFPLGIFLLSTPTRSDEDGIVMREIEAYDGLVVLDDDKFTERFFIAGGTKYTQAVEDLLRSAGVRKFNVSDASYTVGQSGIEFKVGTSKLQAVNSLLSAINYTPIWVDADGNYTSYPYVSPSNRASEYTYEDNDISIIYNGMEEELDLFSVSNVWVVTQSNPEKEPLVSSLINDDPDSQTSTVNLGRNIVDFREVEDIADQETLDAYTERIAFEASQLFGKLKFKTALMPFHEYSDVLEVRYSPLEINDSFSETSWTMELKAGGQMTHEVRKVVNI
jgi:hypothetical protein